MDVCLTSASRTGYSHDLCRVLAAPNGYEIQFRYAQKWISPSVQEKTKPREALVCFIDQTGGGTPTLLPLRYAEIVDVRSYGLYSTVSLKLGNFAVVEDVKLFNNDIRSKHTTVPDFDPSGNIQGEYWFFVRGLSVGQRCGYDGWENVVEEYYKLPSPNLDTPLYFINGIREISTGASVPACSLKGLLSYRFESGTDYELIVNHYHDSKAFPDVAIGVDNSSEFFWVTSNEKTLDTRYDVKRFKFRAKGDTSAIDGSITIYRRARSSDDRQDDLTLTYQVGPKHLLLAGYIVLSGLATMIPALIVASRFPDKVSLCDAGIWSFVAGALLASANLAKDRIK